jgi:hypothetical protein
MILIEKLIGRMHTQRKIVMTMVLLVCFMSYFTPLEVKGEESNVSKEYTEQHSVIKEAMKAGGAVVVGSAVGYGVAATCMTVPGMVGSGAEIGAAGGPIGIAMGGLLPDSRFTEYIAYFIKQSARRLD